MQPDENGSQSDVISATVTPIEESPKILGSCIVYNQYYCKCPRGFIVDPLTGKRCIPLSTPPPNTQCDCNKCSTLGLPCIRTQTGCHCDCGKHSQWNFVTKRCDCVDWHHGPFCQCKSFEWYDKRYKTCHKVGAFTMKSCLYKKCERQKNAYCQAIGPNHTACTDFFYKKTIIFSTN